MMPARPFDLMVLGAGAAGMLGALLAARRGLSVALVDPHYSQPNNLFISGGLFPAAGSSLQRAAGINDSPENWLDDLQAFAGDSVNQRIAPAIADALPRLTDYLASTLKAPIRFLVDVPGPGHRFARFHSLEPASGRALHGWLRQAVASESRIDCVIDRSIDAIERQRGGYVLQVAGQALEAPRLMLSGGGFGGNPAMVAQYIPEMRGAQNSGTAHNDGSVIALALGWGATLAGMDGYQGQGHTNPGATTRLGMSLPTLGAVMVNRAGRRFVREDIGPSALAARVLAQPGQVALDLFDAHIEAQLGNHSAYVDARAAGKIIEADTLDALSAAAGIPADAIKHTLEQVTAYARGATDPLGRGGFARVLAPPYRASWVTGSLAHTQGGLVTDACGRVLDQRGDAIAGLFAAGGSAAGLSGKGGDGYLPGNGLAQSFGLAWLALAAINAP